MFTKTIIATATAALIAFVAIAPAHAGAGQNGIGYNGIGPNGVKKNGVRKNGEGLTNSRTWQDTSTGATGFAIERIELPPVRE